MSATDELIQKVRSADWHDIPRGYYADTVVLDSLDVDDPDFCKVLGYKLFERKVARVCKTGRVVGRDAWTRRLVAADGVEVQSLLAYLDEQSVDPEWDRQIEIALVLEDVADGTNLYRYTLGQITGRCGWCGKALTDPDSKMRGIGPECAKGLSIVPSPSDETGTPS